MHINLLPPELRERQRVRRLTALVVLVGILLLAALGAFYLLQVTRLSSVRSDLEDQQATNAALQAQVAELQQFDDLQRELEANRNLVEVLLQDQVYWSGVLRDVSLVIPGEAWLTGLTGTITTAQVADETTAPTAPVQPGAGAGLIGQITFTGVAFDQRDVALWLSRLEDVEGFVNPWLANSTKVLIGEQEAVEFNNSVDMSEGALARRGGQS